MNQPQKSKINRSRRRLYEALPPAEEKAIRTVVEAAKEEALDHQARDREALEREALFEEDVLDLDTGQTGAIAIADAQDAKPPFRERMLRSGLLAHVPIEEGSIEHQAVELIESHTLAAAAWGLLPIPVIDMVAVTRRQLRMLEELAALYGLAFDIKRTRSDLSYLLEGHNLLTLGGGLAASLIKSIPILGALVGGPSLAVLAGASTWGVGRAFMFRYTQQLDGSDLSIEELRGIFEEEEAAAAPVVEQVVERD